MEYPKIETLYNRDEKTFAVTDEIRCAEFSLINRWLVTEKIDGTNVRIVWHPYAQGWPLFRGRHENAQLHTNLLDHLNATFTADKFTNAFDADVSEVWLYGEGYGAGIQKGGGGYSAAKTFRLFDVRVGEWWLNWPGVEDIAHKFGISTAPVINKAATLDEAIAAVGAMSRTAIEDSGNTQHAQEGIVCRTDPLLFDRRGHRVMWKLKMSDYKAGAKNG